ncbi:MAG: hypothetical protein FWE57_10485 [Chitinispirillia bacterium]|nr:hypothetical protein [Chitinispirillia bacterium]
MKRKLTFFTVMLFSIAALASDLPKIAVYVTGAVPEGEKNALGTRMLASLVNSGRYIGIERSGAFVAEIMREQQTQRSGAVDDSQISQLGKQFGVKYVCIAAITPAFGSYQVSARIVDVETAAVVFIGEVTSQLRNIRDMTQAADKIVQTMFGDGAERSSLISMGFGGVYSSDFGGGILWGSSGGIGMPYRGVGAYMFLDVAYAEISAALLMGGGKWISNNENVPKEKLPETSRTSVKIGVFGKYPAAVLPSQKMRAFPLLGIDYEAVISSDERTNGVSAAFETTGDLSVLWFKGGGGADIDISKSAYLRTELLYGLRTAAKLERDGVDASSAAGAKTRRGHGLTLRCGAAVRF